MMSYNFSGLKFVDKIVPQANWDYSENVKRYKPNFFIHGDIGNQVQKIKEKH